MSDEVFDGGLPESATQNTKGTPWSAPYHFCISTAYTTCIEWFGVYHRCVLDAFPVSGELADHSRVWPLVCLLSPFSWYL